MFATKAVVIASLVFAGVQALEVSTPSNVAQCGNTAFTISGATGAYHLSIVPFENSCESDALFESDAAHDGTYTWKTNLPAGTQVYAVVDDDSGAEAWSNAFTIGDGDAACLNASSSSSSSSTESSTTTEASSVSTPASSTHSTTSASRTNIVINSRPSNSVSVEDTPQNVGNDNSTPKTGAGFSNAQANLFTVLAAVGVVAFAL